MRLRASGARHPVPRAGARGQERAFPTSRTRCPGLDLLVAPRLAVLASPRTPIIVYLTPGGHWGPSARDKLLPPTPCPALSHPPPRASVPPRLSLRPAEIMLAALAVIAAPVEEVGHVELLEKLETNIEKLHPAERRELFPLYSIGAKCARNPKRRGCPPAEANQPMMKLSDAIGTKGPVKALEMLALNDDLNTVVSSDNMCTRRHAMARAAGLAAGLALASVNAPAFAAETKMVKMGADSGQLVFVPDEIKICKGDSVTWVNNKGGPHNVVFDEDAIPAGVSQESISMDDQLGEEGETFTKKFDTAGKYAYYCEPHRGAGMNANLIVD